VLVGHDYSLDIEGNVYPGHAAKDHPNQWQKGAVPVIGHDGKKVLMNQTLAYYRNIMAACCYWVERNGTPVLNATPHGLLNWRPTNLVDALTKEYQPIVDFITGNINESLAGDTS